jgi:truncated hemoglobin YjbI
MPLTPTERSLRAKIGAHALHAQRDGAELTKPAREAFLRSFEAAVDPAGVLAPDARRRRAEHARRAHMARLSLASSRARARRRTESVP